ncbi:MAG: hypothetical protein PHR77_16075 [Kiritimatiellae bacterium]|nr:hypothetical protein [Kiritimatiellia bacterium]MDD5523419.1 hypothetical protein [Kiritimatiellia bacterium]
MKIKCLILSFCIIFIPHLAFCQPGQEIPEPKPQIEKAINIARDHYLRNFAKSKWDKEFIITSVVFSTPAIFMKRSISDIKNPNYITSWYWFITFTHPKGNDVSYTFAVRNDGSVIDSPVRSTE